MLYASSLADSSLREFPGTRTIQPPLQKPLAPEFRGWSRCSLAVGNWWVTD